MQEFFFKLGQTSVILNVQLVDSTTFLPKTAMAFGDSGLVIGTITDNEVSSTAYTTTNLEAVTTIGTYAAPTSGKVRFKKVDDTNHPGIYQIQIANARFAVTSAKELFVTISGISGLKTETVKVHLLKADLYDAVRLGLGALPNVAAEAPGGLYTQGSGAGQINQSASGQVDSKVVSQLTPLVTGPWR